ncbi:hypothetical protein GR160_16115 [Flavobacterium sp. Sd200]|uniref:carboxypeptidase-like regulatory domain-containing protein n=1 Tax=Flavobacterium sp. Sd200 TaxID=2692211 RepID=UPI00136A4D4E|nr:carboxypeptidase-like regulatory domain-containing protein [Flavobacterium sp. Sd200]MXN92755.1 hypothetical protein [Flavobacterium sp. Sd200]
MKNFFPLLAFLVLGVFACDDDDDNINTQPCTDIVVPALKVVVVNAATQAAIGPGLTVTATDGSYIEELDYLPEMGEFRGVDERTGTYTITVTGAGYQPYASQPVNVTEDECHVITQTVNVALQPAD